MPLHTPPTRTPAEQATITAKLARLHNRGTAYELAMSRTLPDGTKDARLVAYTPRRNRNGLFDACCDKRRVDYLMKLTGSDNLRFGKRVVDGATMGEWTVNFSGRTQREAIIEGELPYVGD